MADHYEPLVAKNLEESVEFSVGDLVAFKDGDYWKRGTVEGGSRRSTRVFGLDHGWTVDVKWQHIMPLDRKFCDLPALAVRVKLAGETFSSAPPHFPSTSLLTRNKAAL